MLAAASEEPERARQHFEDAIDRYQQSGAPFELSLARIELAICLVAMGRHDDSNREATLAYECLSQLGATSEAERARLLIHENDDEHCVAESIPPITSRERDVLRLLASGLTNRQIADKLFVSEHTVHRHVTNILRKLDLPTRTAAAAYAVQTGLVSASEQ
jgi:DNA-binding NarL/FixJ family response regulator